MPSYLLLKTLHVAAAFAAFAGVAAVASHAAAGGRKRGHPAHGLLAAVHGASVLVLLLAGFLMLFEVAGTAALPSPAWMSAKLLLWLLLAALVAVPYRWPRAARWLLAAVIPALGLGAAAVAILKPF